MLTFSSARISHLYPLFLMPYICIKHSFSIVCSIMSKRGAMGYNVAGGTSNMLKSGHSSAQGLDEAVLRNIEAAKVCISYYMFHFPTTHLYLFFCPLEETLLPFAKCHFQFELLFFLI
jgi:hypothetical protein